MRHKLTDRQSLTELGVSNNALTDNAALEMTTLLVEHAGYVQVCLSGPFSFHDAMRCFVALSLHSRIHEHRRLLLDMRELEGMGGITEEHLFGTTLSEISHGLRISILHSPGQAEPEGHLETVLSNRGASVKVFTDNVSAVEWIQHTGGS
jgi:hypothetical protein